MKKIILGLIILTSFVVVTHTDALAARKNVSQIVATTTLDDSPTSVTGTKKILSAEAASFFVTLDETEVGNSVSIDITADASYDGTTWATAAFYDVAGGSTLQTTQSVLGDDTYYFWLDDQTVPAHIRINITGNNTDADDTATVAGYMISQEN